MQARVDGQIKQERTGPKFLESRGPLCKARRRERKSLSFCSKACENSVLEALHFLLFVYTVPSSNAISAVFSTMERVFRTVVVKKGKIEDDGFDDGSGFVRPVVEMFCRTEDGYCDCVGWASCSREDDKALVEALSRYPNTSELRVYNGNHFGVRALENIIRCHPQLTKIKVHGMISLMFYRNAKYSKHKKILLGSLCIAQQSFSCIAL